MDDIHDIAQKLFYDLDNSIRNTVVNLPEPLGSLNDLFMLLMPTFSSLIHLHLNILSETFIEHGDQNSHKELFMSLLSRLTDSCKEGYDTFHSLTKKAH